MPKIVFSPPLPPSIMERAGDMVPDGFDFEIIAEDDPDFLAKMHDVEYLIGFARDQFGPEFYRAAPNLKLIQLLYIGENHLRQDF